MSRRCVTHHNACDCIEEARAAELAALRKVAEAARAVELRCSQMVRADTMFGKDWRDCEECPPCRLRAVLDALPGAK